MDGMTKMMPNTKNITASIAATGITGEVEFEARAAFASIFGIRNTMKKQPPTPINSQAHEKIDSNARAQRRAMMEPIPSQTSATAKVP